jgi:hypothetical protein
MTEDEPVRDVLEPEVLATALAVEVTRDDEAALAHPVSYALTRGPNGRRGTDPDQELLGRLIRSQGGYNQLLAALARFPGLPAFVGAVLYTANNLGTQGLATEFVDTARDLRDRWPPSFTTEFAWWLGGARLESGNLTRPAIAIANTLGDGDLVTAHRQALAAVDLLELVLGEIRYTKPRDLLGTYEKDARKAAKALDPAELDYRRTLITDNLEPALVEHARWQKQYG